jgi:hypothetical protein
MVPMSETNPSSDPRLAEAAATAEAARHVASIMPDMREQALAAPDGTASVQGDHEGTPYSIFIDMNTHTEEQ